VPPPAEEAGATESRDHIVALSPQAVCRAALRASEWVVVVRPDTRSDDAEGRCDPQFDILPLRAHHFPDSTPMRPRN